MFNEMPNPGGDDYQDPPKPKFVSYGQVLADPRCGTLERINWMIDFSVEILHHADATAERIREVKGLPIKDDICVLKKRELFRAKVVTVAKCIPKTEESPIAFLMGQVFRMAADVVKEVQEEPRP